jgi:hypothetical protein
MIIRTSAAKEPTASIITKVTTKLVVRAVQIRRAECIAKIKKAEKKEERI